MTHDSPAVIPSARVGGAVGSEEEFLQRLKGLDQPITDQEKASIVRPLLKLCVSRCGVCHPLITLLPDIVGRDKTVLNRWWRRAFPGLSVKSNRRVALILECQNRFERLLEDIKRLEAQGVHRRLEESLMGLGYDKATVEEATVEGRRSTVEMACAWLERIAHGERPASREAASLRNTYSKCAASMKRIPRGVIAYRHRAEISDLSQKGIPPITLPGVTLCGFCTNAATGIVRDETGHSVRHCAEHGVAHMPSNVTAGWSDCLERLWWTEKGKVLSRDTIT